VKVVQGVLQAVDKMAGSLGVGWILVPLALLLAASITGSTSAWVGGSARILFVSGIDRYLPRAFGKVHPKYHSPHIALIAMAALSSSLVVLSFLGGAGVKEAYQTLLDLSVVLQMISYLYLFGVLAVIAFGRSETKPYLGRGRIQFAAVCGLLTTIAGGIVAFVPSRQVESIWRFELKMFGTTALFLALAAGLFVYYSRRRPVQDIS
jgi:amino acid transporter